MLKFKSIIKEEMVPLGLKDISYGIEVTKSFTSFMGKLMDERTRQLEVYIKSSPMLTNKSIFCIHFMCDITAKISTNKQQKREVAELI